MAKAIQRESTKDRKKRRNEQILKRYQELKMMMTCRDTYPILMAEFDLAESTIIKIVFDKSYSLSPLAKNVASVEA